MKKAHFKAYMIASLMVISAPIYAEEMSPVSVFGSQDETQQAGSAHFIDDDEMKAMGYTDAERVLRRIPGVYSQTEDGYGLRTNLGMRGTSALRTTKINILEDGVPQGPAIEPSDAILTQSSFLNQLRRDSCTSSLIKA